jgi:hypothetical protein
MPPLTTQCQTGWFPLVWDYVDTDYFRFHHWGVLYATELLIPGYIRK